MTDPVVPPSSGGQFPPPNAGPQGFPPPNAGGQFPPPNAGAPGFPPPNAGAPGFPPPNAGAPGAPAPFPGTEGKPKKGFAKKALGFLGTIVIIVIVAAIKFGIGSALSEDPTKDAKAGDCIGVSQEVKETTTEVEAKIVECSSSDAKYTVLGRVEGIKDENSKACDDIINNGLKEGEEGAVIASQEDKGYLLCLKVN
ncbi:LppU/SCO3897 family protein [Actinoplanes philippinensis]|uniref:LppU/SCO3897 family protein n=1 Tax=Actinoplanes philippinensis TaxID=35752 RepID=UPI0033E592A1